MSAVSSITTEISLWWNQTTRTLPLFHVPTVSECDDLIYSCNNCLLRAYLGQSIVLGTNYKWSHPDSVIQLWQCILLKPFTSMNHSHCYQDYTMYHLERENEALLLLTFLYIRFPGVNYFSGTQKYNFRLFVMHTSNINIHLHKLKQNGTILESCLPIC